MENMSIALDQNSRFNPDSRSFFPEGFKDPNVSSFGLERSSAPLLVFFFLCSQIILIPGGP